MYQVTYLSHRDAYGLQRALVFAVTRLSFQPFQHVGHDDIRVTFILSERVALRVVEDVPGTEDAWVSTKFERGLNRYEASGSDSVWPESSDEVCVRSTSMRRHLEGTRMK